jgi:hypothetical protein
MPDIEKLKQQELELKNKVTAVKEQILDASFSDAFKKELKKEFVRLERERQEVVKKIVEEWGKLSDDIKKAELQPEILVFQQEMEKRENESYFADTYGIAIDESRGATEDLKTELQSNEISYDDYIKNLNELIYEFQAFKDAGSKKNRNKGKGFWRKGKPLNKAGRE